MFYYSGGNNPHSSKSKPRNDSIGLARSTTNAFAGLRAGRSSGVLRTAELAVGCSRIAVLASTEAGGGRLDVVAMAKGGAGLEKREQQDRHEANTIHLDSPTPVWTELHVRDSRALDAALSRSPSLVLEVEAVQATLFAVRTNCPLHK